MRRMRSKAWIAVAAIVVMAGLAPSGAARAEGEAAAAAADEQAAMQAAFDKAAAPGAPHAWLQSLAGSWEFHGTFWMAPGAEPVHSMGSAVRTALLGGRVLREEVTSTMFGQPFEGLGFTGFDNLTGKYWSTWTDNMSTSLMLATGTCAEGKCSYEGTNTDPMTGQPATSRMLSEHASDREVHSMYGPGPDGAEFKMMELVYTRKQ